MAKLLPGKRWMMRALAAGGLALLLLAQMLVIAGAGRALGSGVSVAATSIVCHAGQPGDGHRPPPAPGSHSHCALCPCLQSGPALDAILAVAVLLATLPRADATPVRAGPSEAPPLPAGWAGAWSSRAPPIG
jgi:hypothetical protein